MANTPEDRRSGSHPLVPQHDGSPADPDADFFVPPPGEIGPLLSAHSTLSLKHPMPAISSNIWLAVTLGLVLGTLLLSSFDALAEHDLPRLFLLLGFALFLTVVWILWPHGTSPVCTYVGRDGLARYCCRGRRDHLVERSVLCFRDARCLRTNHPVADDYPPMTADWYAFAWFDATGRMLFRIAGWWLGPNGPSDQAFHFGVAAEVAWTLSRLDACADELASTGRVQFVLALGGTLRLGRGVLELEAFGQIRSWDHEQQPLVAQVDRLLRLHFGLVNVRGDSVGSCALPLREAADARLLLLLLRTLVLFDLPAVEGSETLWGGRTFSTSGTDGVTNRSWQSDPRVTAFRERSQSPEQTEGVPRQLSDEQS